MHALKVRAVVKKINSSVKFAAKNLRQIKEQKAY
jgi:hypothetical protein